MDMELMGADSLAENTPNAQNLSAQFVCPSRKILDFNEKRLHRASVVRATYESKFSRIVDQQGLQVFFVNNNLIMFYAFCLKICENSGFVVSKLFVEKILLIFTVYFFFTVWLWQYSFLWQNYLQSTSLFTRKRPKNYWIFVLWRFTFSSSSKEKIFWRNPK